MGFRINTAIGWGMPFEVFVSLLRLPDPGRPLEDGWHDHLEEVLAHTRDMRGPRGWPLPVTGPGDTVADLITFVGYDDISDVILMPSADEARRWHRRDDDIDYALIWGPRGPDDTDCPENKVEYLTHGHHPYGDMRMNAQGVNVARPVGDDEALENWRQDRGLLPGIPLSMRHWIGKSELLDNEGISHLRPIRAVWWA